MASKITRKEYTCPLCKNTSMHETNHYGEIYTPCKVCKSSVLYCSEEEALKNWQEVPKAELAIHTYRFNIENQNQLKKYEELMDSIQWKRVETYPASFMQTELLHALNNSLVSVQIRSLFNDQWVTEYGRLHDHLEWIFPNKNIKKGYFLELTEEILQLRENTHICGYCGRRMAAGLTCEHLQNCKSYGMKPLTTKYKSESLKKPTKQGQI